jgi:hypothetical protein
MLRAEVRCPMMIMGQGFEFLTRDLDFEIRTETVRRPVAIDLLLERVPRMMEEQSAEN